MPSLLQSLAARPVVLWIPSALSCWKGTGSRMWPPYKEMVGDLIQHLDACKSVGLDGIHLRVLRELAKELTKPLSIIYQQS